MRIRTLCIALAFAGCLSSPETTNEEDDPPLVDGGASRDASSGLLYEIEWQYERDCFEAWPNDFAFEEIEILANSVKFYAGPSCENADLEVATEHDGERLVTLLLGLRLEECGSTTNFAETETVISISTEAATLDGKLAATVYTGNVPNCTNVDIYFTAAQQ